MDTPKRIIYISHKSLCKRILIERMRQYLNEAKSVQYVEDKLKKLLISKVSCFAELIVSLCKSEQEKDVLCVIIDSIDTLMSEDGREMIFYLLSKIKLRKRVGILYTSNIFYAKNIISRVWALSKYIADVVIEAGLKPTIITNTTRDIKKVLL